MCIHKYIVVLHKFPFDQFCGCPSGFAHQIMKFRMCQPRIEFMPKPRAISISGCSIVAFKVTYIIILILNCIAVKPYCYSLGSVFAAYRPTYYGCIGGVAVRRRSCDRKVAGSNPGRGAIKSTRSTQPSIPQG